MKFAMCVEKAYRITLFVVKCAGTCDKKKLGLNPMNKSKAYGRKC